MRAIVSGATGYLGGRLIRVLVAGGHDVIALARESSDTNQLEALLGAGDTGGAARGDVASLAGRIARFTDKTGSLEALVASAEADAAFHLAAAQEQGSDPESARRLLEANVVFGGRFVSACAAAGVGVFVSAGTYSTRATGIAEYHPASLYAATKRAFEDVQTFYSMTSPMRCATLELTDTYGPGDPRGKFLRLVAEASAAGTPLSATIGEQRISLVHADDVASAFIHAAHGLLGSEIEPGTYSVAAEDVLTLREVVDVWRAATGRAVDVRWGERPYPAEQIMRPYTEHRLPGWSPAIGLHDGLTQVYRTPTS